MRLFEELRLTNLLSFGPDSPPVTLGELNVLIGTNGAGKSNFIEAVGLLKSAPTDLVVPVREGGGVRNWLWKGAKTPPTATLEAVLAYPAGSAPLRYRLSFAEAGQRFEVTDERIESARASTGKPKPYFFFGYEHGRPMLNVKGAKRELRREDIDPQRSILSQRKDPDQYPEVTYVGEAFGRLRVYREWSFGRYTAPRLPQPADLPNDQLQEDGRNLGLVLNRLRREPAIKHLLLEHLSRLYAGVDDYEVIVEAGTVQVFLQEGNRTIPSTRLSDGTLRYLCLLAILCHPTPSPLICIEEPELGLHPDIIPHIATLLRDAATRTQLIVTTHSDILVDALTDASDAVIVCEKRDGATHLDRLSADALAPWLEKYRLGDLWTRGDIGGTRW